VKKTRFASLLVLCAIIAAVSFFAGRSTVRMEQTTHTTAEHVAWGARPGSLQAVPQEHGSHGAGSASEPTRPGDGKPKGKRDRKILYWRAPMDPNYISDKPGKSPMGMDLVPVYEDEVSSGEVRISPTVVQEIGVTTAEVVSGPFNKTVRTYGTSMWNETTLAAINTKINGWIETLTVNETGQLVHKGQPLAEIYSPELVSSAGISFRGG